MVTKYAGEALTNAGYPAGAEQEVSEMATAR